MKSKKGAPGLILIKTVSLEGLNLAVIEANNGNQNNIFVK